MLHGSHLLHAPAPALLGAPAAPAKPATEAAPCGCKCCVTADVTRCRTGHTRTLHTCSSLTVAAPSRFSACSPHSTQTRWYGIMFVVCSHRIRLPRTKPGSTTALPASIARWLPATVRLSQTCTLVVKHVLNTTDSRHPPNAPSGAPNSQPHRKRTISTHRSPPGATGQLHGTLAGTWVTPRAPCLVHTLQGLHAGTCASSSGAVHGGWSLHLAAINARVPCPPTPSRHPTQHTLTCCRGRQAHVTQHHQEQDKAQGRCMQTGITPVDSLNQWFLPTHPTSPDVPAGTQGAAPHTATPTASKRTCLVLYTVAWAAQAVSTPRLLLSPSLPVLSAVPPCGRRPAGRDPAANCCTTHPFNRLG